MLVYGRGGVGKSTLAASSSRPVFLASEDGLENIDAVGVSPASWKELLDAIDEISTMTSYDTIVIDSLDWFEPLCWEHVCKIGDEKGPKKSIEDFGYGKGYVAAMNEWRILVHKLSLARNKGKAIILIAHAIKKTVKNPSGEDYDAWGIKLNEKAAGLLREWVDVVGFAEPEIVVTKLNPNESNKGVATGKRVLRTNPSATYESKTRYALPPKLPLEWKAVAEALRAGSNAAVPELRKELHSKLMSLATPAVSDGARKFLDSRGESVASLREAIANVDRYMKEKEAK
jgi:hypothetical protein